MAAVKEWTVKELAAPIIDQHPLLHWISCNWGCFWDSLEWDIFYQPSMVLLV